ncbi:MAG: DUF1223 domain-containing protein [Sulfitobacter sp.]|nr:DUF1223 domain-containing protein [Sulfitobacter sp.]
MKSCLSALFAALLSLATPAWAEDHPVVVELFTSQGCSSCPSADALLHELADREDIIALALHVDYWDYIGWKDPFGAKAHSARQRSYAAAGQRHMIFTPEMIVQGQTDIVGTKPMKVMQAVAAHAAQVPPVKLTLDRKGDELRISAEAESAFAGPVNVHLLRYSPLERTEIKRGENAGKTLDYANVVEGWQVLGQWDGKAPLRMQTDITGDKPVVVILQSAETGPILAAARLR